MPGGLSDRLRDHRLTQSAPDLIEQFLTYLRAVQRSSPHTVASYWRDLTQFKAFLDRHEVGHWQAVDTDRVRAYAAGRHRTGLGGRSIARELSAIRSFYEYLIREGHVVDNPAQDVRSPKARRKLPAVLDVEEVMHLLTPRADNALAPLEVRDHAILELAYSSGLRLAELVTLDLVDVDLTEGMARVTGKGRKTRDVPVGQTACQALRQWLTVRLTLAVADERALFVSRRGSRLTARAIQHQVHRWARRQGLLQRVYPHLMRHSCASHLLESSGDLRAVQEILGHADITTTQVYTHLDFQHLAKVYDQAHPRARKRD